VSPFEAGSAFFEPGKHPVFPYEVGNFLVGMYCLLQREHDQGTKHDAALRVLFHWSLDFLASVGLSFFNFLPRLCSITLGCP